jgi:glutamyl-tRNA reductase
VNKLLHLPTVRMKEAAAGADGAVYADAVRRLFDLEPGGERAGDDPPPGQPRQ